MHALNIWCEVDIVNWTYRRIESSIIGVMKLTDFPLLLGAGCFLYLRLALYLAIQYSISLTVQSQT